jgi:hypothetical protein
MQTVNKEKEEVKKEEVKKEEVRKKEVKKETKKEEQKEGVKDAQERKIVITDTKIIDFFETRFVDPTRFIQSSIDNFIDSPPDISSEKHDISKLELIRFQNEYNLFLNQKKTIINSLRETAKQIDAIDFENLDAFLCNKSGEKREEFPCLICNVHVYKSKKALSTHQRKCRKDNENSENEEG